MEESGMKIEQKRNTEQQRRIQGCYAHFKVGKKIVKKGIFLFNDIDEQMIETVITHESLHLALDRIGISPETLDCDIELKLKLPLVLCLEMFLTSSSSEELEVFSDSIRDRHKIVQEKFRKHKFVELP
jgi:hypothetical protein